jgi:predicted chitinase
MPFEKVLPLPPLDQIGQQTIFHCGPGSAENILVSLGIPSDEWELAMACRTTENGTDWIGQIRDVLNQRAHHIDWRLVEMPHDPATPAEKQKLWDDAVTSIVHAGAPMLMNFVAPVSNYPRASRPSPIDGQVRNPSYGGGTVWHYVTCFGVAEDDNGTRHHLIVDSGFNPTVYWITHDQCATLIPPKGYVYGHSAPVGVPTLPGPVSALDEGEMLSQAMGESLPIDRYRHLVPAVKDALRQSECTNPRRVAEWFAQIGHESAGLLYMEELADGSAYEGRQDLGNIQPGDGVRFKGHGPIQITGRENHRQVSEWAYSRGLVPTPTYFVDNPTELGSDTFGFLGAAWYWTVARGDQINQAADREDHETVTRLINGGLHGYEDRVQRYHRAIQVADQFVPRAEPAPAPTPAVAPPTPEQAPAMTHPSTPLTGFPHHHSQHEDDRALLLNIRAEGLLTQRLVFEIAARAGIDARRIYEETRDSF